MSGQGQGDEQPRTDRQYQLASGMDAMQADLGELIKPFKLRQVMSILAALGGAIALGFAVVYGALTVPSINEILEEATGKDASRAAIATHIGPWLIAVRAVVIVTALSVGFALLRSAGHLSMPFEIQLALLREKSESPELLARLRTIVNVIKPLVDREKK